MPEPHYKIGFLVGKAHVPMDGGKIVEKDVLFSHSQKEPFYPIGIVSGWLNPDQKPAEGYSALNIDPRLKLDAKKVEYLPVSDADREAIMTFKKQLPAIKRIDRRAP